MKTKSIYPNLAQNNTEIIVLFFMSKYIDVIIYSQDYAKLLFMFDVIFVSFLGLLHLYYH